MKISFVFSRIFLYKLQSLRGTCKRYGKTLKLWISYYFILNTNIFHFQQVWTTFVKNRTPYCLPSTDIEENRFYCLVDIFLTRLSIASLDWDRSVTVMFHFAYSQIDLKSADSCIKSQTKPSPYPDPFGAVYEPIYCLIKEIHQVY